jgi:Tol biopolymer transport system component
MCAALRRRKLDLSAQPNTDRRDLMPVPRLHLTRPLLLICLLATVAGVSAASATPPGKNGPIVFRRYFDDQQTWGAVFTIQPDGSRVRQITRPPQGVVDDQPSWAPDGSAIAFTRCAPGNGLCHVWTVSPDGSAVTPVGPLCPAGAIEQTCTDDAHAAFSLDSKQLVFVQSTGQVKQVPITGQQIEHSAITVMNLDGTGRRVVYTTNGFAADLDYPVRGTHIAAASFSPDGSSIVLSKGPRAATSTSTRCGSTGPISAG